MYNYIQNMSIYVHQYIVSFFCKIFIWYKKNNSNNEKTQKIIEGIIFALFLLQN